MYFVRNFISMQR